MTTATDALIEAANASGRALFTRTVLDGRSALRFSIGGRATQRDHVEAAWDAAPGPGRLTANQAAIRAVSARIPAWVRSPPERRT